MHTPSISRKLERVIVLDTETTGFLPYDRIITLAAMCIEGDQVLTRAIYLVFDPRKDSHPQAINVHGWDNWTTRFQDLFADCADELRQWFDWGDRLVMHNADFDMRFLQREFRKAEQPLLEQPTHCTLAEARERWPGKNCGLDDCAGRVGLPKRQRRHCALHDAFLTTAVYLNMRGVAFAMPNPPVWPKPTNLRPCTPRPGGDLPRRAVKRRAALLHTC